MGRAVNKAWRRGAVVAWLVFLTGTAPAVDFTWVGGNANWDVPDHWDPSGIPGVAHIAAVTNPTTITL